MASQMGMGLLDRGAEITRLGELIAAVRSGSGTVVAVEGPAGIGKTRLVEAGAVAAEDSGLSVLRARPGELEREFAWGVVRGLFESRLRLLSELERERVFAGAARLALPVLGHGGEVVLPGGSDALAAAMHGLYWLVANLAELGGVLIALDDAHWADQPSRQWLTYLAGRISELPAGLLIGARPAEPGAAQDIVESLDRVADQMIVLRPAPLSEEATSELVREALGDRAESGFCRACQRATGGNPFVVGELLVTLNERRVLPFDVNAGQIETAGPERLGRWVLERVRRLGPEATRLVDAVAVLGARVALSDAAALAELDVAIAARAADELTDAGVLVDRLPLEFVHPLVRAAVYERLPLAQRALAHRDAVQLLARQGADDERIAVHLLEVEPADDPEVVARLRAVAEQILARGAPGLAARYLERALEEPPSSDQLPVLMYRLGAARTAALGPAGLDAFERAVELCEEPEERAAIALEFSHAARMMAEFPRAARVLGRALDSVAPNSPLATRLDGEFINVAALDLTTLAAAQERLQRYADPEVLPRVQDRGVLAVLAQAAVSAGAPRDAAIALARRAVSAMAGEEPDPSATVFAALALMYCDEFEQSSAVWERFVAHARATGSVLAYGFASCFRAQLAYRVGNIREAEEDARTAVAIYREWGARPVEPSCFLAAALIERGAVREAGELLGAQPAAELPELWDNTQLLHTRGRVRLEQNQLVEALEDLREVGRRLLASGFRNPALLAWRSDAALALQRRGHLEEARALADEEVSIAQEFGTPRALGIALRASGLVQGGAEGIERLSRAAQVLAGSGARVAHARALCDFGAALRRSGRRGDARDPLRHALELAMRAGATRLADYARGELVAAGARPRRDRIEGRDALTASELRVATMAAEGLSNPEIAQGLFVTRRTVETHLTSIYRKLDIASREELGQALAPAEQPLPIG